MKIGIDAGGTKTLANLFDQHNHVIQTSTKGFGNPLIDYHVAIENIETTIYELLQKSNVNISDISTIAIGSAGAESGDYIQNMISYFEEEFQTSVHVMSDLKLSHIATFSNQDGILLIAGTGSSALSQNNGGFSQKGGWGHILGDEGSGYWLGLMILKQLMRYFEGSSLDKDAVKMIPTLLEKIPTKKDVIHLTYREPKTKVANLAQFIKNFEQTEFIQDLSRTCASHLAQLVLESVKDYPAKHFNLALEGSIILKNQIIQQHFLELLNDHGCKITLKKTVDATFGVLDL